MEGGRGEQQRRSSNRKRRPRRKPSGDSPDRQRGSRKPPSGGVGDLIDHLAIPRKKLGIVSVDGTLVKESKTLSAKNYVRMYQPISGG